MPRRKKEKIEGIAEALEYLGLDLDNIPESLKNFEPLEYRVPRFYDEKQYKQYRYVDIKDIQILLSPTNRLTDLNEKYKNHKLTDDNEFKDSYECHITPDWLLVYKYQNDNLVLILFATGSHSELFKK